MIRFLSSTLVLFAVVGCLQNDRPGTSRYTASDHLYWQRSFPDQQFDIEGWRSQVTEIEDGLRQKTSRQSDGKWVVQGPANAGARINTIAVHPTDQNIILVGFSSGGIYKTRNGGRSWYAVFDRYAANAIGDIAFDPSNPSVLYAGTGDPNISGTPFVGRGLYRSDDEGEHWFPVGLDKTGIISEIIVDPNDSRTVYVATMGVPYYRDEHRGLYRTTNGGTDWNNVLFVGEGRGIIDIVQDPRDSKVLYAAAWDRVRNYEESTTTGVGTHIYKSMDGGNTWQNIQAGLPDEEHSRVGLALARSNPDRLYTVYVGEDEELQSIFTTENGGADWDEVPTDQEAGMSSRALGGFGWYFGKIRVNPEDEHDLFLLGVNLWRWNRNTQKWSRADLPTDDVVHADKHDMVFAAPNNILLATDGGLYRSNDQTMSWSDTENIPATQFYHVAYNPHQPDLYYGGAQDNGSVRGNASIMANWVEYFGGDGFRTLFHPTDSAIYYVETQLGGLDVTTDGGKSYSSVQNGIDWSQNVNWDAPVIMSRFNPDVLYFGTDRVYRSTSGPDESFKPISGSLIDDQVFLAATSNVTALAESHFGEDTLFAGTGDGNIYRTVDDGSSWENISAGLPDRYITSISTSPSIPTRIFVTHSGFKSGEQLSHIHLSDDLGNHWQDISGDLPSIPVNDLYVLPANDDKVLFAATDGGVYFSTSSGASWQRLGENLPVVPVFDLEYNPDHNALIAGTFAKSIQTYDLEQEGLRGDSIVSSNNISLRPLQLWPNPVEETLFVKNLDRGRVEVIIYNAQGLAVVKKYVSNQGIDVQSLPPGLYVAYAQWGSQLASGKFIKL